MSPETLTALTDAFGRLVPEMILGVGACILFLGSTFRADRHLWAAVSILILIGAGLTLALMPRPAFEGSTLHAVVYGSAVWIDGLAMWVRTVAIAGGIVLVLCSWNDLPDQEAAEYHGCLLILIAGLCLTGSANELITLFLALEMISIPTYVMLYLPRPTGHGQEAAMKYFLLSIFSSALLLLGFAYLYGLTGTTNLPALTQALSRVSDSLPSVAMVALIMVVAGLGFRITAVPFHFYAPDVYQGTTTSMASLLAFVPKAAGFVALARLLGLVPYAGGVHGSTPLQELQHAGSSLGAQVPILLWILAAVTMTLGNLLALLQDNLKRLLAYSSVAHAGYMLIGLAVAPHLRLGGEPDPGSGVEAVLFYLVAYAAMTIGAFTVIGALHSPERAVEKIDDLAGLGRSRPGMALVMALFLFSLIGIPITAGFVGKLFLFLSALAVPGDPGVQGALYQSVLFRILAFVGAINAAVGAVYYLRIVAVMYLRETARPVPRTRAWPAQAALAMCLLVTLVAGIFPQSLWRPTQDAIAHPRPASAQVSERIVPPENP